MLNFLRDLIPLIQAQIEIIQYTGSAIVRQLFLCEPPSHALWHSVLSHCALSHHK